MRALIVDDERLARNELRRLLQDFPEIEVVGEAKNAVEAQTQIEQLRPELLFLDVRMPGDDGFQLLERLEAVPLVIFTTAYDQYALKAFEVNALDYLVKPIAPDRLAASLERIGSRRSAPEPSQTASAIAPPRESPVRAPSPRIFIRDGDRCWFVALEDIALLESEGNYTRLFFGGNKPLLLRSLNYLQERLDPAMFFRANRKQIINMRFIEAIDQWPNSGYRVRLRGGLEVVMSRRQGQIFQELTKI
jgi:two-component system, LytTR family, response regulator